MQPPFLHIENLTISFLGEEGKTEAVRNKILELYAYITHNSMQNSFPELQTQKT